MRSNRVHVPVRLEAGDRLKLPEGPARHLARVLRLRPGDAVVVFDGEGVEHDATVEVAAARRAEVTVGARREPLVEPALSIELVQGVARGERMDLVVQKAVELGVASIRPVWAARSVVRLDGKRAAARIAHWQAVAVAASEQCGRATVPVVHPAEPLRDWLEARPGDVPGLLLDPLAGVSPLALDRPGERLSLLVGPEGGLDESERAAATSRGLRPVRLGPRVLRTETAGLAALTAAQLLWGDLGDGAGDRAKPARPAAAGD